MTAKILYHEVGEADGVTIDVELMLIDPREDGIARAAFFTLSSVCVNKSTDDILRDERVVLPAHVTREQAIRQTIVLFETLMAEYGGESDDTPAWIIAGMRN